MQFKNNKNKYQTGTLCVSLYVCAPAHKHEREKDRCWNNKDQKSQNLLKEVKY